MIVTDELIRRAQHSARYGDPSERTAARLWLRKAEKQRTTQRVFRAVKTSEAIARPGT